MGRNTIEIWNVLGFDRIPGMKKYASDTKPRAVAKCRKCGKQAINTTRNRLLRHWQQCSKDNFHGHAAESNIQNSNPAVKYEDSDSQEPDEDDKNAGDSTNVNREYLDYEVQSEIDLATTSSNDDPLEAAGEHTGNIDESPAFKIRVTNPNFLNSLQIPRSNHHRPLKIRDFTDKINTTAATVDEDRQFMESLMPHIRLIPKYKKLVFRSKVQELVQQFAYEEEEKVGKQTNTLTVSADRT